MRAFAARRFTVARFGAWHLAVGGLVGATVLALGAWVAGQAGTPQGAWVALLAAAAAAATIGLGCSLAVRTPVSLDWDGHEWRLGGADSGGGASESGALCVSLDLGVWMLLRFEAGAAGRRRHVVWLPVQRHGLESQWHALRCAVHAPPRDDRDVDATAEP